MSASSAGHVYRFQLDWITRSNKPHLPPDSFSFFHIGTHARAHGSLLLFGQLTYMTRLTLVTKDTDEDVKAYLVPLRCRRGNIRAEMQSGRTQRRSCLSMQMQRERHRSCTLEAEPSVHALASGELFGGKKGIVPVGYCKK